MGCRILHHIAQMICNGHAITKIDIKSSKNSTSKTTSEEQVRIATAIYPSASMMNHSCDQNIANRSVLCLFKALYKNLKLKLEVKSEDRENSSVHDLRYKLMLTHIHQSSSCCCIFYLCVVWSLLHDIAASYPWAIFTLFLLLTVLSGNHILSIKPSLSMYNVTDRCVIFALVIHCVFYSTI